ncbi:MAG: ATP-binding protein [Bacillota bacterium]
MEIKERNFEVAGECSSRLKENLRRLGVEPVIIRRTSIVTYELEMNIVIHSHGGKITVGIDREKIYINARDCGPGIKDVEKAFQPGFSTAGEEVREMGFGAGMGLNNVKKYSDDLELESAPGEGTNVESMIYLEEDRD